MIGTDPEVFIIGSDHRPVPAHRLFPPKGEKVKLASGGYAFRDGYAVELNVDPVDSPQDLVARVGSALLSITRILPAGFYLSTAPVVTVGSADLSGAPADVLSFGCEPSYCAWTNKKKTITVDPTTYPERSAGAHMHFSALDGDIRNGNKDWLTSRENHCMFIKLMDLFVGLPLVVIYDDAMQFRRRKLYGQAGEFRPQDYGTARGLEYRTPPPQLFNHASIARMAFAAGQLIFENFHRFKTGYGALVDRVGPDLRAAINDGRQPKALLQHLEYMYTPQLIDLAAADGTFRGLQLPYQTVDEVSWSGWARTKGIDITTITG